MLGWIKTAREWEFGNKDEPWCYRTKGVARSSCNNEYCYYSCPDFSSQRLNNLALLNYEKYIHQQKMIVLG